MTQFDLLSNGYFAKELPPPFQTKDFASKYKAIEKDWRKIEGLKGTWTSGQREIFINKFRESKWVMYSIPKVGYSRRLLGIPNPYHQNILCRTISTNWSTIEKIYSKSTISSSKPLSDKSSKRAVTTIQNFELFKRERLINAFDKTFEIRSDVSRFYPTIYTHIIPWVIHGKAIAKARRKDKTLLGNVLDQNLRESNSGQTLGIPIGPDTSLIIAEIIGCTLDEILQSKFKSVKSFRYFDDYYLYCDNQSVSEKAFKYLQALLTEYQLDINEEKTKIQKIPFPFDSEWSIELGSFTFRKTAKGQQTDLERFLSLAFKYAALYPKDSVLKFAIQCIKRIALFDESWELYQSIILRIALTEPVTLDDVAHILVTYKKKVSVLKVKSVIEKIIKEHTPKGHNFEVAWALWICKEFGFKIPDKIATLVFESEDVISILIALELKQLKQINNSVSTKVITTDLTPESLMGEKWLLTYEALHQKWLKTSSIDPVSQNEYFDLLRKHGVSFYDKNNKLSAFKISSPKNAPENSNNIESEYNGIFTKEAVNSIKKRLLSKSAEEIVELY